MDCAGDCLNDADSDQICDEVDDCIGSLDALGVCNGNCTADADADGICDDVDDCVGALDACGVCNGPGEVYDCGCADIPVGDCDCNGNQLDAVDVCGGNCTADADDDGICDNVDDCVGDYDACGVCNGPGAIYDCGCEDIPAGDCDCNGNQLDALGVCGGNCTSDADQDGICDADETAGCTDETACNYNPDATDDDGSCAQFDACGICDGPGAIYDCGCSDIPAGDCDCNGNQLDALDVCGGTCTADADADGICDDVDDCIGALDACGVCNGPGAIYDCGCSDIPDGDCDCNGGQIDALGVCGGDCPSDANQNGVCDDVEGSGCADPEACNFDPFADPNTGGQPVNEYCLVTEVVNSNIGEVVGALGVTDLTGFSMTRVYIQTLDATDFVTSVSGNSVTPLNVSTTTSFYQNALGAVTPENINPLLLPVYPDLAYDSWVTIGVDGPADASLGESAVSVVNSPNQNWALGFDPGGGLPGGNIVMDDAVGGVWYVLNGDANGFPDADGLVLLGQFTTDGDLSGMLNVQVFPQGDNENFLLLSLPFGNGEGCAGGGGGDNCLYDDALGECGGDCAADADNDGICDDVDDCVGDYDACGICNGPGAIYDCGCDPIPAGNCDCNGNQEDALGVCGGDCTADADEDGICDDVDDCVGAVDECGVCNGPGATDECGCDPIPDGDCDCNGNQLDAAGVCGGDCTADTDGDGICDDVDDCVGDVDACGICNGPGAIYECGCADIPDGDCDCDGNQEDALGVCGGDCPADLDGNGICDNLEGSGCGDPDACNYDPFADPVVDEPVTDYCLITEVVTDDIGVLIGGLGPIDMTGYATMRVYLQTLHPTDFVTSVSGNSATPLNVSTTTSFYQNSLGGVTPENVNPLLLPFYPDLAYDSWVTIGVDGPADALAGESAASVVNSPNQNWALAFDPGGGALGGNIVMDDDVGGVWYILNGDVNGLPDADGRVLLGQFTTDGDLSGTINVQVFPQGDNENFLVLTLPLGLGVGCSGGGGGENCLYDDALGECGGDCAADADSDGICDDVDDCVGTIDACGVCNGPGAIYDCGCDCLLYTSPSPRDS